MKKLSIAAAAGGEAGGGVGNTLTFLYPPAPRLTLPILKEIKFLYL